MAQAIVVTLLFFSVLTFGIVCIVLRSQACVQSNKRVSNVSQRGNRQLTALPLALQRSVHPQVQNRLFQLLNGDRKTAERLLAHARQHHPGQTEHWYWEKVMFDLERDRHI
ncbi:hypothetical protein IQ268_00350 [Oculatella sp. LEGE 06141]|uniref:hypothetical protein n=1 Tax=Oculatella sp. LEGE 06141 TaxID=1828648 RepID=UPI00187F7453|nr:hypothetical protein [Oculatella sp. LEGE 06141]MBE9177025.1 hypothetical protein [Oculatella sp. LEGE 06141]